MSPVVDDSYEVAAILAHELIHGAMPEAGHGPKFAAVAAAVKLEGKPTATVGGEAFRAAVAPMISAHGIYPHGSLEAAAEARKKQGTRLLKASCDDDGYTVRVTRKWVEQLGAPVCPCGRPMTVEGLEDGDGEAEGD